MFNPSGLTRTLDSYPEDIHISTILRSSITHLYSIFTHLWPFPTIAAYHHLFPHKISWSLLKYFFLHKLWFVKVLTINHADLTWDLYFFLASAQPSFFFRYKQKNIWDFMLLNLNVTSYIWQQQQQKRKKKG